MKEALGTILSPTENEDEKREIASVQEKLGDDAFALAWEQGRAMTMEQAIEYALKESES